MFMAVLSWSATDTSQIAGNSRYVKREAAGVQEWLSEHGYAWVWSDVDDDNDAAADDFMGSRDQIESLSGFREKLAWSRCRPCSVLARSMSQFRAFQNLTRASHILLARASNQILNRCPGSSHSAIHLITILIWLWSRRLSSCNVWAWVTISGRDSSCLGVGEGYYFMIVPLGRTCFSALFIHF